MLASLHLLLHLGEHGVLLAVEEEAEAADVGPVRLAVDPEVARGGALVDRVEQAGAEPAPAGVALLDVERAGAELEDLLEHLDRPAEALGAGERAVELHAAVERLAGEVDAGEVLAGRDLEVRERLVVLEVLVVLRLDVLDQPGFHQEGVDLAVGGEEVDVDDLADPVADPAVVGGRLLEVRARPGAEVLRLADVDHPPLGVLHQVEAGRGRERADLLAGAERGRRDGVGLGRGRTRVSGMRPRGVRPRVQESWGRWATARVRIRPTASHTALRRTSDPGDRSGWSCPNSSDAVVAIRRGDRLVPGLEASIAARHWPHPRTKSSSFDLDDVASGKVVQTIGPSGDRRARRCRRARRRGRRHT